MTIATILLLLQSSAEERAAGGMTVFSWSFMIIAIGAVTVLTVWCYSRILSGKEHFDPDGTGPARPPVPGEVDPNDV